MIDVDTAAIKARFIGDVPLRYVEEVLSGVHMLAVVSGRRRSKSVMLLRHSGSASNCYSLFDQAKLLFDHASDGSWERREDP